MFKGRNELIQMDHQHSLLSTESVTIIIIIEITGRRNNGEHGKKMKQTILPELPLGTIATLGSVPCSLLRLGRWAGGGIRRLATFPRL